MFQYLGRILKPSASKVHLKVMMKISSQVNDENH